jgi:predicted DNA-binding protein
MSIPDNGSNVKAGVKTLAIRLEPDLHAQLSLIAQLRSSTITDEIRTAIEAHIALARTAPELATQAGNVLEDIEREAIARRAAIATLFGTDEATEPSAEPASSASSPRGRNRKTPGETEVTDS